MTKHTLHQTILKAFRNANRNITGRQKGGVITRMVKDTGAGCDWEIDPSVPTACWSWNGAGHQIKCGLKLHEICNSSTRTSEAKMKRFAEAVIRHETEHGRQSDRTNAVGDACQTAGVPFRLWNLFEDCRIEYNSAIRSNGDGAFRWVNFQDVDDVYSMASSLLWATKTNEAGIKKQPSASVPKWSGADEMLYQGKSKKTRLIVLEFYRRAIACATSLQLIPICQEWISIFGAEVDDSIATDNINGVRDPNAPMTDSEQSKDGVHDDNAPAEDKPAHKWSTTPNAMNDSQVSRIARSLNQVIQNAKVTRNRLNCNGNKLDASQAMQGSEKAFRNRGRTNGKRSLALIIDMSGSMTSTWRVDGGKEFVLAFRELARQNKLDLEILLTQNYHTAQSYRVRHDDCDQWLNDLHPDGNGEQIMKCMKRFDSIIKRSTTSVIFTDSYLADSDIDTEQYRRMGLNTIACYIEPKEWKIPRGRSRMNEHFARSVIATEANELARRLMREILKD
jgi:hypothetical protein